MKSSHFALSPYDVPLMLFLISAILGLLPAYDPSLGYKTLAALASGAIFYFFVSRFAVKNRWWNLTASLASVLFGLVALYFITQAGYLGYEEKIGPITRLAGAISSVFPSIPVWRPLANSVATFLEGGIFLVLGLALTSTRRNNRLLFFAIAGLIGLALFLSASRGAWLAVFGAGLVWTALYWKPARYVLFALLVGLVGLVAWVAIRGDITVINQIPVASGVLGPLFIRPDRLEVYRNSIALIADVPFTGIGLGDQFALVYSRYGLLLPVPFLYYAHNLFLEIWLEQGILGEIAWVWIWAAVFTQAFTFRTSQERVGFESTWISLTAILIHSISDARQAQSLWCWLPFFINLSLNSAILLKANSLHKTNVITWIPPALAGGFLIVTLLIYQPLPAILQANQASLLQQKADLTPGLSPSSQKELRLQADRIFQQVLNQQPSNRTANQRIGFLELDNRDYPSAIRHLEAARIASPDHPGIRKALGLAYTFEGSPENAVQLLGDIPRIVDELNYWGWYFNTNGSVKIARNAYQVSILINPNQPDVKNFLDGHGSGQ